MKNITNNDKAYWTMNQPIAKENLFLAQDWNNIDISINNIDECISTLTSSVYSVFNNPISISSFIISVCPPSTSYLSTINGLYNEKFYGISTVKINGIEYWGTLNLNFIRQSDNIVNTFNGKIGNIPSVLTGIEVNGNILSTQTVDLSSVFLNNETFVRSINDNLTGDPNGNAEVITSLAISGTSYNTLNDNYQIVFPDNFDNNLYKKDGEILTQANINTPQIEEDRSIFNIQMFNKYHQISAELVANVEKTLQHVIDWVCITDQNYNIIHPTTAKLVNNTLKITSPSAGIIYFISEI